MNSKLTHRLLPLSEAGVAEAGDCLEAPRGLFCLPAVVNIGVQKAGTGELQTWLGAHPLMLAHGGEVHFFDGLRPSAAMLRCGQRQRTNLRQRYARHLWHRRPLSRDNVGAAASSAMAAGAPLVRRLAYEKTPAYFDLSNPALLALEHFKSEPFECMDAVQRFLGLPPHDYRASATRNEKGLWVIGKSKSSSERRGRWDKTPPSPEVNATLHQFYAPWQRTLAELLRAHNLSLLPARPIPG
ncbi:hypothetical protein EMIHUDRAFT_197680 [Emiliania huxleyi CCMP1516]|uniref:Sulfotransferase domain-containing protein n=2 Tax=Emiliania huxleyi TaxID=2903 RepID=A0A0D3IUP0_EMIH1|nr:hypothetical protein EMIHUDRAFT_197680 [Emiliania huxleyi CCMP1516]EOD14975.1 hypothetical protein EMIHUDRAFT_197680 [Emiliania huxleyi CCMP1516]|eukprot:XP_005767404.1 hypothetical protein EMIHUDRAFT_197680 [Emiliania huxleyi CCMP1516]